MNEGLISRRYAKALYEYADERGEQDAFYQRMLTLATVMTEIPRLRDTLTSPMVADHYKRDLLEEATGKDPEQTYRDFVRLILTNRREASLQDIALSYADLYRREKNICTVRITSAQKLTDEALARFRRRVEGRTHGTVEFSNVIDPTIGGGFIFQMGDTRLDASVKGQLDRLRRKLMDSPDN
jgi:F-type H+-transporting ATPase subunit delta